MARWIDKANEKAAITECRQAVMAAQGTASEAYAKGPLGSDAMMREPYLSQIRRLSEVEGDIAAIAISVSALVTHAEYTSPDGILVVYDISQTPVYQASAGRSAHAGAIAAAARRLWEELSSQSGWDSLSRDKQTQALQDALLALYNGAYPELTRKYRKLLADKGLRDAANLNWRPILSRDGTLLLAASAHDADKRNPQSVLIY